MLAESFLNRWNHEVTAIGTVLLVGVVIYAVDRAFRRRRPHLDPTLDTRLRFVRRLVEAALLVVGVAIAISQFTALDRLAASILASGAIAAAAVGFAARQTLANVVAGVMLAVTQPIRIGDLVTFEEQTGEVEDMHLAYTYIRLDDGRRLVVPNERLAQSSIQNHTVVEPRVQVEVSVWLPHGADLDRALELVAEEQGGADAGVAEVAKEGVRLSATTWVETPSERGPVAARLRAGWLRRLRAEGLSSELAP